MAAFFTSSMPYFRLWILTRLPCTLSHVNKRTSWLDPRRSDSQKPNKDLPAGWEEAETTEGLKYYIEYEFQPGVCCLAFHVIL